MRFLLAILLVCGQARMALAEPLPEYDSAKYCEVISGAVASAKQFIKDGCLHQEAINRTRTRWIVDKVDSKTIVSCDLVSRQSFGGSYQMFVSCIALAVGNLFVEGKVDIVGLKSNR